MVVDTERPLFEQAIDWKTVARAVAEERAEQALLAASPAEESWSPDGSKLVGVLDTLAATSNPAFWFGFLPTLFRVHPRACLVSDFFRTAFPIDLWENLLLRMIFMKVDEQKLVGAEADDDRASRRTKEGLMRQLCGIDAVKGVSVIPDKLSIADWGGRSSSSTWNDWASAGEEWNDWSSWGGNAESKKRPATGSPKTPKAEFKPDHTLDIGSDQNFPSAVARQYMLRWAAFLSMELLMDYDRAYEQTYSGCVDFELTVLDTQLDRFFLLWGGADCDWSLIVDDEMGGPPLEHDPRGPHIGQEDPVPIPIPIKLSLPLRPDDINNQ